MGNGSIHVRNPVSLIGLCAVIFRELRQSSATVAHHWDNIKEAFFVLV